MKGLVESKQCTVDPQKSPGVRCVLSDDSQIIDSSEKRILLIKACCSFASVAPFILLSIINKCMQF